MSTGTPTLERSTTRSEAESNGHADGATDTSNLGKAARRFPLRLPPCADPPTAPVVIDGAECEEPREWLWTPVQYRAAAEAGLFDGIRVELLDGRVYVMSPMGDDHRLGILLADSAVREAFGSGHTYFCQLPTRLEESQPEPDLLVLRGGPREMDDDPSRVLLVVEVSFSTLRFDQTTKASTYAAAGFPDYWLTNLVAGRLEVRRRPTRRADGTWEYAETRTYDLLDSVAPLARPDVEISVADLLP